MTHIFFIAAFLFLSLSGASFAQTAACDVSQKTCVIETLLKEAEKIENVSWQSQTYREAAKTLAGLGLTDQAIALVDLIKSPDTQALTIRGIGMAAAGLGLSPEDEAKVFKQLRAKADTIVHPPSFAIALTYIAMAQAFGEDDDGAWKTASEMKNDALRNKAYGETAEIQAEFGKFDAAMKSISFINTSSFRNKAYETVSQILSDHGYYQHAYDAAQPISNAYKKAEAVQYLLNKQYKESEDTPAP